MDFFPPNKRTSEFFARHFSVENLDELVKYHNRKVLIKVKEEMRDSIVEMIQGDNAVAAVRRRAAGKGRGRGPDQRTQAAARAAVGGGPMRACRLTRRLRQWLVRRPSPRGAQVNVFVKQQMVKNDLNDVETVDVVWDALMKAVEWPRKTEQCEEVAIKQVKEWGKILTAASTSPRAELALLNKVQVYCYEDTRLTKTFAKIVTLLYQLEAFSEHAINYWYTHGTSAKGKGTAVVTGPGAGARDSDSVRPSRWKPTLTRPPPDTRATPRSAPQPASSSKWSRLCNGCSRPTLNPTTSRPTRKRKEHCKRTPRAVRTARGQAPPPCARVSMWPSSPLPNANRKDKKRRGRVASLREILLVAFLLVGYTRAQPRGQMLGTTPTDNPAAGRKKGGSRTTRSRWGARAQGREGGGAAARTQVAEEKKKTTHVRATSRCPCAHQRHTRTAACLTWLSGVAGPCQQHPVRR